DKRGARDKRTAQGHSTGGRMMANLTLRSGPEGLARMSLPERTGLKGTGSKRRTAEQDGTD
ncbi:hypothetical protein, partial [Acetobacter persici]|uniref:hypothetical protein n=1 Tax=Acetobacter persici TaxID=1076596 RepID=UPI0039EAFFAB